MKLAEALQERADINRKIQQLTSRISDNVLVQEGEQPLENPEQLKRELDGAIDRLTHLIACINDTNCKTIIEGQSLTQLLAKKDTLIEKISSYRSIIRTAGNISHRARGTEIKIKTTISVPIWQKELDSLEKELRLLDNRLQESNWKTELIES